MACKSTAAVSLYVANPDRPSVVEMADALDVRMWGRCQTAWILYEYLHDGKRPPVSPRFPVSNDA